MRKKALTAWKGLEVGRWVPVLVVKWVWKEIRVSRAMPTDRSEVRYI